MDLLSPTFLFYPGIPFGHQLLSLLMIFRKIEQDNCFIIQQFVNKTLFAAEKNCGYAALCKTCDDSWQPTYIAGYLLCTDDG